MHSINHSIKHPNQSNQLLNAKTQRAQFMQLIRPSKLRDTIFYSHSSDRVSRHAVCADVMLCEESPMWTEHSSEFIDFLFIECVKVDR